MTDDPQLIFSEHGVDWVDPPTFYWNLSAATIRGLSLTRPCPFSFTDGPEEKRKRIENRPWKPPARMLGRFLALHAAKEWSDDYRDWIRRVTGLDVPGESESPHSIIFAVCRVVGCVRSERSKQLPASQRVWFLGPFAWLLDNYVPLDTVVPCAGGQRLWKVEARPGALDALRTSYQAAAERLDPKALRHI